MNPGKDKRVAVRFTEEADLSSLPPRDGFHDPEGSKPQARREIEEAIAAGKETDGDRKRWPKASAARLARPPCARAKKWWLWGAMAV